MNIYALIKARAREGIVSITPDASTQDAARELERGDIGALLVADNDLGMAGVLSERDLVRAYARMGENLTGQSVSDLMTREVISCSGEDDVMNVMEILHSNHIRHIPVVENGAPIAMLSLRDFEHACREFQQQAMTDSLTGLPNRRAFLDTLEKEVNRHRRFEIPLSVAVIDIDFFKSINDTYGHDAGDQVLRSFARILLHEFRTFDSVGRIGGEEFGLLFPHTSLEDATRACERIMSAIEKTVIKTDAGEVSVTISTGLTSL
ncbi:MAG: GGDEF domain-containing protein, partial [Pseudomonadota bacterium]